MLDGDRAFMESMRAARKRLGMSQQEVADALGLHVTAVSKMENGERRVSVGEAGIISGLLGISLTPRDDDWYQAVWKFTL